MTSEVKRERENEERRTPTGEILVNDIVERLCEQGEPLDFLCLGDELGIYPTVFLSHLIELRLNFTGELDAVLDGGIRLEGFTLDFVEQVWSAAEELVVRELPRLGVRRCPLSAWRLHEGEACIYPGGGEGWATLRVAREAATERLRSTRWEGRLAVRPVSG